MSNRRLAASTSILTACLLAVGCYDGRPRTAGDPGPDEGAEDPEGGGGEDDPDCVSNESYFEDAVQPVLQGNCQACHFVGGDAQHTKFILQSPAASPDYLERNLAVFTEMAKLEFNGVPWIILKPSGDMEHKGGIRWAPESDEELAFMEMIDRIDNPVDCLDEDDRIGEFFSGVDLLDAQGTLRKAALSLVGRLPTDDEVAAVEDGGMDALDDTLRAMTYEEPFYERIRELYNDHFLTRRYHSQNGEDAAAIGLLHEDDYPGRNAWQRDDDPPEYRIWANDAIAEEPTRLLEYILRNDLPYSELLTADYTVVNPFSAKVLGVSPNFSDNRDPEEFVQTRLPGIPHAGVATMTTYLTRFPTTRTNRNRHRSRMFQEFFLATDVQALGTRPTDATGSEYANPTMEDSNCVVCHETVDPVAGTFANWTDLGAFRPPGHAERGDNVDDLDLLDVPVNTWYSDMRPPGFLAKEMPAAWNGAGLQWLAKQTVKDPRFALSAVHLLYRGLTGQKPLVEPTDPTANGYIEGVRAAKVQREVFQAIADDFRDGDYDLRTVIIGIVKSQYYRAYNFSGEMNDERRRELNDLGMGRQLTPEQLHRKIIATTGVVWGPLEDPYLLDEDEFLILYGGIDSDEVTQRVSDSSGSSANIAKRMSMEVACASVPQDFSKPAGDRLMFPHVEENYGPGIGSPGALDALRANVQYLHEHLLGEVLEDDDPNVERTLNLWLDVFEEGQRGLAAEEYGTGLPAMCQATVDANGDPLDFPVTADENYIIRSWIATVAFLLTDYRFTHE